MEEYQPNIQAELGIAEDGLGRRTLGCRLEGGRTWRRFEAAVTGCASLLGRLWPGSGNKGVLLGAGESQVKAHPWKGDAKGRANF